MVIERVDLSVAEGAEAEFLAAFDVARHHLLDAPGNQSVTLHRGVERPTAFMLLIVWDRIEDHMEGFRNSPAFGAWRELVGPFFVGAPVMEHFVVS